MKTTHRLAMIAAAIGATILPLHVAAAQTINTQQEYYQGRWVWNGVYKAINDPNNVSYIQFVTPTQAVYCYKKDCRRVAIKKALGDLTFTSDGKNYFELTPAGTRINGRFWVDMRPPARSPDATVVFNRMP